MNRPINFLIKAPTRHHLAKLTNQWKFSPKSNIATTKTFYTKNNISMLLPNNKTVLNVESSFILTTSNKSYFKNLVSCRCFMSFRRKFYWFGQHKEMVTLAIFPIRFLDSNFNKIWH